MILDAFFKIESKKKEAKSSEENINRSILKTISWRIIGTLDTLVITYFITGTIKMALSIGFIEFFSKMLLYFFHERAWNKIKLGK